MTLEEKINHLRTTSMEEARAESNAIIDSYRDALEKYLKTIKLKQNDRCRLVSKRKLLMPDSRKTRQWRAPSWI